MSSMSLTSFQQTCQTIKATYREPWNELAKSTIRATKHWIKQVNMFPWPPQPVKLDMYWFLMISKLNHKIARRRWSHHYKFYDCVPELSHPPMVPEHLACGCFTTSLWHFFEQCIVKLSPSTWDDTHKTWPKGPYGPCNVNTLCLDFGCQLITTTKSLLDFNVQETTSYTTWTFHISLPSMCWLYIKHY